MDVSDLAYWLDHVLCPFAMIDGYLFISSKHHYASGLARPRTPRYSQLFHMQDLQ